jgi:hypothetical protein
MTELRYLLLAMFGLNSVRQIRRVKKDQERVGASPPPPGDSRQRRQLITGVTWLMGSGLLIALLAIVVLALLERAIPDILPQVLTLTLGYFGGAFAAYFRFDET